MDTKPLESFAKAARRELMVAVEARVSAVLAAGSVARSERADTVRHLESDIAEHGRGHVVDRVAYTWFNRLIALRFMDARGYTDAGVVSPASGQAHGQPEILADAKRGVLDSEVVTKAGAHDAILGLLDGTRRSTDAEGEAYALLLTEYCRHWHKTMPFMFEAEGAYTELLVPAGLLADGAPLSRAREVLTEDVCDDVEVIGWLYQFYISERKDEVFAGFKKNKKAGADEIPAATQLFTPHWIVRYLLENSLGRLWMLNRPASRLAEQMDYYIAPVDKETDFLKVSGPEELTVIDPACGSGHMLTYAFDLLYAIYEEEGYAPSEIARLILTHNLHGTEIDPRAGALAAFALTMKARAKDRRFFARSEVQPKICVIEPISFTPDELGLLVTKSGDSAAEEAFWNQFRDADVLGSLIQPDADATAQAAVVLEGLKDEEETLYYDTLLRARRAVAQAEVLSRQYSAVTANPPYMGSKNMNARLVDFAKSEFKGSKSDLFAMFIQRCLTFAARHGATAMVTMQSWMFISSYEELREKIVHYNPPVSMVHLGERAFDSIDGAVVSTTAFVLEPGRSAGRSASFIRVVDGENEAAKRSALLKAAQHTDCEWRYTASPEDFAKVPGTPIAYRLSDALRATFATGTPLAGISSPKAGMHGGDVNRFARMWHEVSRAASEYSAPTTSYVHENGKKWVALNKGGKFRKWYGNQDYVIAFDRDTYAILAKSGNKLPSRDYYFRPSVSWSKVSSGAPSIRYYPEGFVFDVAGTPVFSSEEDRLSIMAILNSELASTLLAAIAPTLNFEIEQVASLPIADLQVNSAERVRELVATSKEDWDSFETSWNFSANPIVSTYCHAETTLSRAVDSFLLDWEVRSQEQLQAERENNRSVASAFGVESEISPQVALEQVSLTRNAAFRWPTRTPQERKDVGTQEVVKELVSFAVGCMFGRFSLDAPGLILANKEATLKEYLAKVPDPTFRPDVDNVIPFVDDDWFEDDIVEQFRHFLRTAFGTKHFEENLSFVESSLGVKNLRDYFMTKIGKSPFYDDHLQRYKKRPIYWMFSSPKGSFNALIYLHRYTPSTVSTVLNEYLREYENKLRKALERAEVAAAGGKSAKDQAEADRLRRVLTELRDYEHDVLYPLATQQIEINLDDGVLVNYLRMGSALRVVKDIEKDRQKVGGWTWPTNPLETSDE
ncbi:BREX-1 system adenine-specific DNA-methyltransferase PglX [Rhodococcus sp. NPDC003322]